MASEMTPAMLEILLNGPAMTPPPGVQPNFIDPPNFANTALVVELIFLILSTLAVIIRAYTKLRVNKKLDLEDFICFMAWGLFIGLFVVARFATGPVGGRHQWDVQFKFMKTFLYNLHVGSIIYGCIVFCIKASILLQYIRIFSPAKRGALFWACHILIWLNLIFYAACFFLEIFSCKPIAKAWDPLITTGQCIDVLNLNIAASAVNVISDFIILLLPQATIWKLQMSFDRRLAVSSLFAVASLACISAAVRLYYCVRLAHSPDSTWYVSLMSTLMWPELGIGIILSSLPAVTKCFRTLSEKPLFSKLSTSLHSILGRIKVASSEGRSGDTRPKKKGMSYDELRFDRFDRIHEEHELHMEFS